LIPWDHAVPKVKNRNFLGFSSGFLQIGFEFSPLVWTVFRHTGDGVFVHQNLQLRELTREQPALEHVALA